MGRLRLVEAAALRQTSPPLKPSSMTASIPTMTSPCCIESIPIPLRSRDRIPAAHLTQARPGKRPIQIGLHCTRRPALPTPPIRALTRRQIPTNRPFKRRIPATHPAPAHKAAIPTGLCSIKAPSPQPIRVTGSISAAPIPTARTFFVANRRVVERPFCPP